jgi:hypothetical protein
MNAPIDKGTISIPAAIAVVAAAFAVGGWAVSLEVRHSDLEQRLDANGRLLGNICKAVNCDGKGLRE